MHCEDVIAKCSWYYCNISSWLSKILNLRPEMFYAQCLTSALNSERWQPPLVSVAHNISSTGPPPVAETTQNKTYQAISISDNIDVDADGLLIHKANGPFALSVSDSWQCKCQFLCLGKEEESHSVQMPLFQKIVPRQRFEATKGTNHKKNCQQFQKIAELAKVCCFAFLWTRPFLKISKYHNFQQKIVQQNGSDPFEMCSLKIEIYWNTGSTNDFHTKWRTILIIPSCLRQYLSNYSKVNVDDTQKNSFNREIVSCPTRLSSQEQRNIA